MRNGPLPLSSANFVLEQTGQTNYVFKMPEEGEQPRSSELPNPNIQDEELIKELSEAASSSQKNAGNQETKAKKNKKSNGKE